MMLDHGRAPATVIGMAKAAKKTTTTTKAVRVLSPIAKGFAARLVELRESQGMTKLELAKRARVSRKFIWELEEQKKEPTLTSADQLAKALGVNLVAMLPTDPCREPASTAKSKK